MTAAPVPRATYRLQLSRAFRFADVAALAPYLERLGISHVYLSPISMARAGSNHGYDVVDHTRLNPELGTEDDFVAMAAELRRHGLGIVLDAEPHGGGRRRQCLLARRAGAWRGQPLRRLVRH